MDLAGKVALVTGAGRGIGRACALALAEAGADIAVNDRPASPDLAGVVREVQSLGRRAHGVEADAFTRSGCEAIIERALGEYGRVDILLSSPACNSRHPFLDFDPDEFERVIHRTLIAGFHMSQLTARHMRDRGGGGKIVFISSIQARMPFAHSVGYGAAKAGLDHMARTLSVELAPHRINVNAIEPGWIDTPGERETFGDAMIEAEAPKLPWGRLGAPEDIGHAAVFLASDAADYITGTMLQVDGGYRFKHCFDEALQLEEDGD